MAGIARGILFRVRIGIAVLVATAAAAHAHDAFSDFIFHRVEFRLGARQLDVTVKLTFFEEWSGRERQRMDENRDGHIGRAEVAAYAAKLAGEVTSHVSLSVAGERLTLIALYEPEIDLLGRPTVERAHHQVTLHYFAPLPTEISPGTEVVVEDRLWDEAQAFGDVETRAKNGHAVLEASGVSERAGAKTSSPNSLRFSARVIARPPVETSSKNE